MPEKIVNELELYKNYPYRCPDVTKMFGDKYLSKEDFVCNHKFSIDYNTYLKIILSCLKHVIKDLLMGKIIQLPYFMGTLQIVKRKPKDSENKKSYQKYINWPETKKNIANGIQKYVYYNNFVTDSFIPLLELKPIKKSKLPNRQYFRFVGSRKLKKEISNHFQSDPLAINSITKEIK